MRSGSEPSSEERGEAPESTLQDRARMALRSIWEVHDDPTERVADLMKKIEPFFLHLDAEALRGIDVEAIRNRLKACATLQDEGAFVGSALSALQPLLDIRAAHPAMFEEAQARAMNEAGGFTEVNRLVSYGVDGSVLHIHAPAGSSVENKLTLYRDGMRKLAEVVATRPDILTITASSSLVASHPGLFTRAGFTVEDVSDDFKSEYFGSDPREVQRATISREEFLKRFL